MLSFIKKLLGFPTPSEVAAAKETAAPYKVETPLVNNKTGDVVDQAPAPIVEAPVNPQITDAVTQAAEPAKKTRKPRAPKAEKPVKEKAVKKEKAAKPVKAAAMKLPARRSKKA